MDELNRAAAISPLRQRLIDDMNMRRFSRETQRNYIRDIGRFASFLGRSPHTATAEDVRRFQIEQHDAGVPTPTMDSIVSALRFLFTSTLDRLDLARKLVRVAHPRTLPVVLGREEVVGLLAATTCLKHQAALSVAYGAGLRVAEVAALKVADIDSERMLIRVERGKGGQYRNAWRQPNVTVSDCSLGVIEFTTMEGAAAVASCWSLWSDPETDVTAEDDGGNVNDQLMALLMRGLALAGRALEWPNPSSGAVASCPSRLSRQWNC